MSDSDESVYQSEDEEIKCILQSSSSSYEEIEERGRVPRFERGTAYTDENHLKVSECLKSIYSEDGGTLYQSPSLMKAWGVTGRIPDDLICDVCILSPTKPVTLLSFIRGPLEDDDERIVKYNTRIARHLVTSVREKLFTSFSVVSGIFDLQSCQDKEKFQSEIKRLEYEANLSSVSRSLDMTSRKYDSLVDFIPSMSAVLPDLVQRIPIGEIEETRHEDTTLKDCGTVVSAEEANDPTEIHQLKADLRDLQTRVKEMENVISRLSKPSSSLEVTDKPQQTYERDFSPSSQRVIEGVIGKDNTQHQLCDKCSCKMNYDDRFGRENPIQKDINKQSQKTGKNLTNQKWRRKSDTNIEETDIHRTEARVKPHKHDQRRGIRYNSLF